MRFSSRQIFIELLGFGPATTKWYDYERRSFYHCASTQPLNKLYRFKMVFNIKTSTWKFITLIFIEINHDYVI